MAREAGPRGCSPGSGHRQSKGARAVAGTRMPAAAPCVEPNRQPTANCGAGELQVLPRLSGIRRPPGCESGVVVQRVRCQPLAAASANASAGLTCYPRRVTPSASLPWGDAVGQLHVRPCACVSKAQRAVSRMEAWFFPTVLRRPKMQPGAAGRRKRGVWPKQTLSAHRAEARHRRHDT